MARDALLSHAPIPPANIHPIPTDGTPDGAASAYEAELKSFYGAAVLDPARPLFEIVLLGLGEDGHTASLFPGTPALGEHTRWVAAVAAGTAEPRITLTYPALASSRHVAFLVEGSGKRAMADRLRRGDASIPAGRVAPVGRLHLFLDAAAAGRPAD
jgi:6-phosphogluconolactonase